MNDNKRQVPDQDQLDEFKKAICNKGYSVEDFDVSEEDLTDYNNPDGTFIYEGEITIERKSTGKKRVYITSSGSNQWSYEFEVELGNGSFD